jgi:hypothetical protein
LHSRLPGSRAGHEEPLRQDGVHFRRGRHAEAGTRLARGQAIPGRRGVRVFGVSEPHADHHSFAGCLAGNVVDRRGLDARVVGEETPLICVRHEVFIEKDRILLTDAFPASLADVATSAGIDFVDAAGNMTLNWPGKLYTNVRGKSAIRPAEAAARELMTPTGLQVIFALLADQHNSPVLTYRELADASGTSLAGVARVHAELRRRGFVEVQKGGRRVVRRKTELLGLWVGGYAERLRPKLVLGRYRAAEPQLADAFESFITQARSKKVTWTVTGSFAADKLIGHYQGDKLTLFLDGWKPDIAGALRWLPSVDGPITVLRPFSGHASHHAIRKGNSLVADPLLVYAELLFEGRERERETARLVYEQYLAHLADAS